MARPRKQLPESAEPRLDVSQERAKLMREQQEHVRIKSAVLKREYAPIPDLERVLGAAVQAVNDRLDALPGQLRAVCHDLPPAAIERVMRTIADARAEWSRTTLQVQPNTATATEDDDAAA
jgi:hypothetical protein